MASGTLNESYILPTPVEPCIFTVHSHPQIVKETKSNGEGVYSDGGWKG